MAEQGKNNNEVEILSNNDNNSKGKHPMVQPGEGVAVAPHEGASSSRTSQAGGSVPSTRKREAVLNIPWLDEVDAGCWKSFKKEYYHYAS
jgi:hypothetical protein